MVAVAMPALKVAGVSSLKGLASASGHYGKQRERQPVI